MEGWLGRGARRLLEALGELLEPEILRAEPERRRTVIPAVRGWSLRTGRDPALASLIVSYRWEGPVVRTGSPPSALVGPLSYSPGERPRPNIGFFALKPASPHAELRRYPSLAAVGTVSLFGRVVEHSHGYRAEGVRIDGLWLIEEKLDRQARGRGAAIVSDLEARYRCDVRLSSTTRSAVECAAGSIARDEPSGAP